MPGKPEVSICGAVDLLAVIFGEDRNALRQRYDLPLPKGFILCLNCDKLMKHNSFNRYSHFCSKTCSNAYRWIPIECLECGKIFKRRQTEILYRFSHSQLGNNKTQQQVFCSRRCLGKWAGHNYGFAVHPIKVGTGRKWDYSLIAQVRYETGWNARKIGQALHIPRPTVSNILAKQKGELCQ